MVTLCPRLTTVSVLFHFACIQLDCAFSMNGISVDDYIVDEAEYNRPQERVLLTLTAISMHPHKNWLVFSHFRCFTERHSPVPLAKPV